MSKAQEVKSSSNIEPLMDTKAQILTPPILINCQNFGLTYMDTMSGRRPFYTH